MAIFEGATEPVYGFRSGEADSKTRVPPLDGVRALSIILVLAGHLLPIGPKFMRLNETVAPLGMSLFFCLSGYLITTFLHRKPDVLDFVIRRVFRIVPALILYLAVALMLNVGVTLHAVLLDLAFISNYFYAGLGPGPTGHLWSLCVEMQFYGAVALVVLFLGRRGLWLLPIAAIVVTGLRVNAHAYVNINTHLRVDEILSGACLALFMLNKPSKWQPPVKPRIAKGTTSFVFVLWACSAHPAAGWLNYLRPYLTAILVGLVTFGPTPAIQRVLSTRPLRYIANISYSLYLYHPLMASGLLGGHGSFFVYLVKRPITFALSWMAAHLSTYYWERPWNEFARRRLIPWARSTGPKAAS